MILVIDNYDSFTWNLVHYLMELGAVVEVVRNDAMSAGQALSSGAEAFLISPGPCTPNEAGISLDLVAACADAGKPLLGVCLGHQAIGQHFGGKVVRGGLMHGKTSSSGTLYINVWSWAVWGRLSEMTPCRLGRLCLPALRHF